MKKLLSLTLIFTFSLLGCTKSDIENAIENDIENAIENDIENDIEENISNKENIDVDYYVKYHYYADGGIHFCGFNITYLNSVTSNSNPAVNTIAHQAKSKTVENEIICGPFKMGDKASIEMSNESSVVSRLLEISVSKNNSPFALRKSTNSRKLEYTIDY